MRGACVCVGQHMYYNESVPNVASAEYYLTGQHITCTKALRVVLNKVGEQPKLQSAGRPAVILRARATRVPALRNLVLAARSRPFLTGVFLTECS